MIINIIIIKTIVIKFTIVKKAFTHRIALGRSFPCFGTGGFSLKFCNFSPNIPA